MTTKLLRSTASTSILGWVFALGGVAAFACGSDGRSGYEDPSATDDAGVEGVDGGGMFPTTDATGGDGGLTLDKDTDEDGVPDAIEGTGDDDKDGIPNYLDPINNGDPPALTLVPITTNFNFPIGIDYHEPTNSVVLSVNYTTGTPVGFERIEFDGSHHAFSNLSGLTDEVKIATARSNNPGGFTVGDLFVGNGIDGEIVRITNGGATVVNPWVSLPDANNGLMRGSLYIDRTGVFGGDLIAVTTLGELWRINAAAVPKKIGAVAGTHLEGVIIVPNKPARFGPLAGKLIVGAEAAHVLYAFAPDGTSTTYTLGVDVEDIDLNTGKENFFGVDFGGSRLLGAAADQWGPMVGDIIITQEEVKAGTSGLFRLKWDGGTNVVAQPIPLSPTSASVGHWEHTTFAAAGIAEIKPVPPVK